MAPNGTTPADTNPGTKRSQKQHGQAPDEKTTDPRETGPGDKPSGKAPRQPG